MAEPKEIVILPGADVEVRRRCKCSGCGKIRLTTRTSVGPRCNDCLSKED